MFRGKIILILIVLFTVLVFSLACFYFIRRAWASLYCVSLCLFFCYWTIYFFCFWIIWPLSYGFIINEVSFRRRRLMFYLWVKLTINLFSCRASEEPIFITRCSFYLWGLPNSFLTRFISFSCCSGSLWDSFLLFDWLLLWWLFSVGLCYLFGWLSFLLGASTLRSRSDLGVTACDRPSSLSRSNRFRFTSRVWHLWRFLRSLWLRFRVIFTRFSFWCTSAWFLRFFDEFLERFLFLWKLGGFLFCVSYWQINQN